MFIPRNTLCVLALAAVASKAVAEFQCPTGDNKSDIPNYVDTKDCRMFYHCDEKNVANHWPCGAGMVFDPNMHYCVWNKECIAAFPFQCTNELRDESFFHADVDDCHRFFYCGSVGQTVRWTCAQKQIFNPNTRSCVNGSECVKVQPKCPAELNGKVFYPDPENCKKYFYCSAPNAVRQHNTCPGEELFYVEGGYCASSTAVPAVASQSSCKTVV